MTERRPIVPPGHEDAYHRYGFAPAFVVGDTVRPHDDTARGSSVVPQHFSRPTGVDPAGSV